MKNLIKHLEQEIQEAERYIESAHATRRECPECVDSIELYINHAKEELEHAEELIECGEKRLKKKTDHDITHATIWAWECEKARERINKLFYEIEHFD